MKVKDLFNLCVEGTLVILDNEREEICRIKSTHINCYEILEENEVLEDEVNYFQVINDKLYVVIK